MDRLKFSHREFVLRHSQSCLVLTRFNPGVFSLPLEHITLYSAKRVLDPQSLTNVFKQGALDVFAQIGVHYNTFFNPRGMS